ncbi:hypothetical protein [Methanohalobium sp.]|uniref:hypothetical protein n=1 Tax=Methanohalobium sp. TaxID=2837493 RepID=UPI0025D7A5BB|nr:hypothetical protein [Methanohalobium sp.]
MKYKLVPYSNGDYSLGNKLAICYVVNSLDFVSDCYKVDITESLEGVSIELGVKIKSGLLIEDRNFIANSIKQYLMNYFDGVSNVTTHITQD